MAALVFEVVPLCFAEQNTTPRQFVTVERKQGRVPGNLNRVRVGRGINVGRHSGTWAGAATRKAENHAIPSSVTDGPMDGPKKGL